MKKKKIYIAGKVTGLSIAEVTMRFGAAQKKLEAEGHEVVNPLELVNDWSCPWPQAMRQCIAALVKCDEVYLLHNFRTSKGAQLELEVARTIGIPITISPIPHL